MTTVTREHKLGLQYALMIAEGHPELLERLQCVIAQASAAPEQEAVAWANPSTIDRLKSGYTVPVCELSPNRQEQYGATFPLYTHPSAEIERLRAENKRWKSRAQVNWNEFADSQRVDVEQKLANAQALLAKSVTSVRYQQGMQNLDHDAGRAHEKRFADLADAIDAFLSATAQPAECETCNGHGLIGDLPIECPDCEPAEVKS